MNINTVLFDIGNVLSREGHESYLADDEFGLAVILGISNEELYKKITGIFAKYAVLPEANESAFWDEIGETLGVKLAPDAIAAVKEQVRTINPEAIQSFTLLQERGVKIGIIFNSTSFFYPIQEELLSLRNYVDPNLFFLSHEKGCTKTSGLFELAADVVEPAKTIIIEDLSHNIAYAEHLGFHVAPYAMDGGESLLATVKKSLA